MVNPNNRTSDDMQINNRRNENKLSSSPPVTAPKTNKNFKSVWTDNEIDDENHLLEGQGANGEVASEETPQTLFKRLTNAKGQMKKSSLTEARADLHELKPGDEDLKAKRFQKDGEAQLDMNSVYPGLGIQLDANRKMEAAETSSRVDLKAHIEKIEELLKRVVDEVNVVRQNGMTKTEVTLMNIKDFEGAKLTLTNYDDSSKRFDIAFTQLSVEAKNLLDANMSDLRRQLEMNHGYNVGVIVTTQKDEILPSTTSSSPAKEDAYKGRDEGEGEGRGRERDEEDA